MRNISFDEGLKSFSINGDESRVICFNPSDFNMPVRADEAMKDIEQMRPKLEEIGVNTDGTAKDETDEALEILKEFNDLIRDKINYIFNADVYDIAFRGQSPLSTVGSDREFLFEAFINSIMPVIQEEIELSGESSQKRIDKYTKEYTK